MLCAKSNWISVFTALAVLCELFVLGWVDAAHAQEPPLAVPIGGPPPADIGAIPLYGWLLYPTLDVFTQNSNNYFLAPQSKISGWSFGVTPSLTAQWSNGIHSTTFFGDIQQLQFPTHSEVNSTDKEATLTQKYSPLPDLSFSLLGDFTHKTISSGLTSAIPGPISSPGTTVLPNGNTVLPNGTIISPSGQVVGQAGAAFSASPFSVVNPYDALTGTAKVEKIFNGGIVTLSASILRWDYEDQVSKDGNFNTKTFTEDASFWLGPMFYAYSDGSFAMSNYAAANPDSSSYRIIGGIGTRQIGMFRTSLYYGDQGTERGGTASGGSFFAGGSVYGGALTYYPTEDWTIRANLDGTINRAPAGAPPSMQALSTPATTPLQIATSSSIQTTAATLASDYRFSPQWTASALLGYTRVQFLGSQAWDNAWIADATLKYDIWTNLTLTWEYQFSSIVSNLPMSNVDRSLVVMSAIYRF